jgi:hypothetical protein
MFYKIAHGYVCQQFNDQGVCVSQEFICGDECDYENEAGDLIDPPEYDYQPYIMEQIQ